jgi:hypothetical protein
VIQIVSYVCHLDKIKIIKSMSSINRGGLQGTPFKWTICSEVYGDLCNIYIVD